ncbi:MAG: PAS domain S-box protein [Candidatus Hydrogenedentes bacterium]|nr:PAS domain S-box protein [Candidatus Hydrogenedentota bacterium]
MDRRWWAAPDASGLGPEFRERVLRVRGELVDVELKALAFLGAIALAATMYRAHQFGWQTSNAIHSTLYLLLLCTAVFHRYLPFWFRAIALLSAGVFTAAVGLAAWGLVGMGVPTLVACAAIASLIMGRQGGVWLALTGVAIMVVVYAGVVAGVITFGFDAKAYNESSSAWITAICSFIFLVTVILAALEKLLQSFFDVLSSLMARTSQVQLANRRLEEKVNTRKAAEDALRDSEKRYRVLFEASPEAIFLLRGDSFVDCNAKTLEMFERSRDDIIGRTPADCSPPRQPDGRNSTEGAREKIEAALDGRASLFEWVHCRHDGTPFHAEVSLSPVELSGTPHLQAIVRDISERKQAEQEVRESEEKYRALSENSTDAIMRFDRDLRFLYANRAVEELMGVDPAHCVGRTHHELNFPEHLCEFCEAQIEKVFETGQAHPVQFEMQGKKGRVVLDWSLFPEFGPDGHVNTVMTSARNITDFEEAQKARLELEAQLHRSQKMEAIGQLAGGVAHDFNNLLQAIQGYTDFAMKDLPEDAPMRESLKQVMKASERAAALVRQLLTFSRREAFERKRVDLNDLMGGLVNMLRRVIGEHIELVTSAGYELHSVSADPGKLEQVLLNLCVNARDAMPEGGKITIETFNARLGDSFIDIHSWAAPGDYVVLSLSDTGKGMSADVREHIFEPFYTTKEAGKGTGLGLATVYGIVKQHEGFIHVDSEPGVGSTFWIYLPAADNAAASPEPSDRRAVAAGGGSETILLAEDDEMVLDLARRILERGGYKVIPARDGTEAVALFEQWADEVDLALLDVVMPGLSGKAVADRIRALRPRIPIIYSSGYGFSILEANLNMDEQFNLINKPYVPDDLLVRIREALERSA